MGFYLCHIIAFSSTLFFVRSQHSTSSKHDEIHRARSQIDSLIFKLTLDLNNFTQKKNLANAKEREAQRLARVVQEEIAMLTPVQHVLEKLAKGNNSSGYLCSTTRSGEMMLRIEAKGSELPKHYTIAIPVNHRELIDRGLTRETGDDLQVYYHDNGRRPTQVNRVIKGLGTKTATVLFRLQASISAFTVDSSSYSLVVGDAVRSSAMDDPSKVYAFYDDFSSAKMKMEWVKVWGQWSVQNGRLLGNTTKSKDVSNDAAEIGVYLKSGFHWKDVEVELDLMETSQSGKATTGPFLRLSNVSLSKTTGWWLQNNLDNPHRCSLRPFVNNRDANWKYQAMFPVRFTRNKWFHLKYRVIGNKFWQWANGKLVYNNFKVEKQWEILKGTVGLGCHKSPRNTKTLYDNIKVTLLVATAPNVTLGKLQAFFTIKSALLGHKELPADSCKQIHDASLLNNKPRAKNGVYWIKIDLQGSKAVQTYCDMANGGWTLVGKISGRVGNIYNKWLVSNHNTAELKASNITKRSQFACLDARSLAVEEASTVLLSSGDKMNGLGSKWVMWRLPGDREKASFWDHSVGSSSVKASVKTPVMVYAWNGQKKNCYQNKFGIMPLSNHGGSYPCASYNTAGNTDTNDNCMAVGVMKKHSTAHGWSQSGQGFDSASSDSDWPNRSHSHQSPNVVVWLK
ncbi:PREDICTED: uncharacterized protein LOC107355072 isoform X2 [Acropora digitifera]|uniref:uncharacterized protein LOC107355072 isoform X2 n=1 Tax=Acropora digitifera TaxID=70779 RepID=UPI00077A7827|nr:PREDICTED: uncharacterized protein LOC107355072 isoform X2 [Acropora digitifera]